jgi:hypothetical protein
VAFQKLNNILRNPHKINALYLKMQDINLISHDEKARWAANGLISQVAGVTRLELATSGVTGRRSNQN